jgi:AcrR family transcriptional regulator
VSRAESQADTRRRLVDAAALVGARRGLAGASLDEVAQTAGFTKGAVYANFASKEALFLAVLDQRFEARMTEVEEVLRSGADPDTQARQAGAEFSRALAADPDWQRLFFEFAVHAARDEPFRVELVARYRALRERIAAALQRRLDEAGVTSAISAHDMALMTFAMTNGVSLESLLEPDVVPGDLLGRMFALLATGLEGA